MVACPCVRRILAGLAWTAAVWAQAPKLQPRGYTNDFAGVLSPEAVQRLDRLSGEVERKTGAQIAVVLIRSLQGEPIENYAIDLARRWGIGRKDNRGILLLLALDDRRSRIEVGYGLEPILPDARTGDILRAMQPLLRQGRYDEALWQGVGQIANIIAQESGVSLEDPALPRPPPRRRPRSEAPSLPLWTLLLGVVGLLWLVRRVGILPLWWLSSLGGWGGSGRSSGGDSGWDGGGFSGFGGGDFGGGGASSDW